MRIRVTGLRGSLGIALLLAVGALMLGAGELRAQHEDEKWIFGRGVGIDFSSGTGVALDTVAMNAIQGAASIADRSTGELLFYSNGVAIWNRSHRIMAGGDSLKGNSIAGLGVMIVPDPGNSKRYYLLHLLTGIAYYTLVDMRLDGGLGAVVNKNTPFAETGVRSFAASAHCNGVDYWIIMHDTVSSRVRSYLLTSSGIAREPVFTQLPGRTYRINSGTAASFQISPDGRLFSSVIDTDRVLLRFNPATGHMSVLMRMNVIGNGACFSPDGSKYYLGRNVFDSNVVIRKREIHQFDVSILDSVSVAMSHAVFTLDSSREVLYRTGVLTDLRAGPDGRIYISYLGHFGWLGVIQQPNKPLAEAGIIDLGFRLKIKDTVSAPVVVLPNAMVAKHSTVRPCSFIPTDWVFYTNLVCAGRSGRVGVLYNHRFQSDTAVAVTFIGEYADKITLDTTLPFLLIPTKTVQIPIQHTWIRPGRHATRMEILGSSGFTYQATIVSLVDAGSRGYDLDATGLPSGLYMVRMDVGGRTTTQAVTLRR